MQNILLVMPRITYAINDWNIPPVGILYVSASMKKAGLPVYTLNLNTEDGDVESIVQSEITANDIGIVCTGDLVVNYKAVQEVVDAAKAVSTSIKTIIGGGLVTHSPEEAMEIIENADFGVIGEGEITDAELIKAICEGTDLNDVDGIIYRKEDGLCKTKKRKEIENLDELPWPDYEGFRYFELLKKHSDNGKLSAPLTTSRSCPFNCTFCSKSGGEKYRQRSLDSIFEEMDYLISEYGVAEIFLNDELFADKLQRVEEFCERIKERHIEWYVMMRISKKITHKLLNKMKEAGCIGIFYGLESADDAVLRSMRKGITVDSMLEVLKMTNEEGLNVRGGFIFGDTVETCESAERTLNWVQQHINLLGNVTISPIVLYPGSALYDSAVRMGKIENEKEHILKGCPLVNVSSMDEEDYKELIGFKLPEFTAKFRKIFSDRLIEELHEEIIADNKDYNHYFICRKCGQKISHRIAPTDMFQKHTACVNCGEKYDFFPNILYFETFEEKITNKLAQDNIAIWGAGETLNCLYECNTFFRENNVPVIDSDPYKQEKGFYGKKVYKPEETAGLDIDTVICCVGNVAYNHIRKNITTNYPNIKQVLWINDIGLKEIGEQR